MLNKITAEDRNGKGVMGLPDTPSLTTTQMQEQFDSLANLAIDKYNETVEKLNGTETGNTGADNITATPPAGVIASNNIQSILSAIALLALNDQTLSHSHANKATLDGITAELKSMYDRNAALLENILTIDQTVSNNVNAIPTSAAIMSLLESYAFTALKNTMYPIGSVIFTHNSTNPSTYIGGTWASETLISGVNSWRRTA